MFALTRLQDAMVAMAYLNMLLLSFMKEGKVNVIDAGNLRISSTFYIISINSLNPRRSKSLDINQEA